MTRRAPALALTLAFLLAALTVTATAAAEAAPQPTSMAAVGDSISQAASTGGSLGADAPQNSWSTGWSSSVDSHAERLGLTGAAHNLSVSGANVGNLKAQMDTVVALSPDPGYLTVLIGGNDLCTDTFDSMTSEAAFESAFHQAMMTIYTQSPGTYVYVVSIPDVYQLWSLFNGSWWARFVWSSAKICQSLLANPTSTQQVDVDRRLAVRDRNMAYNDIMAGICASQDFSARCRYDGGAVFGTKLQASDVSGDYFHPSASGQNRLAETSWNAGYAWTPTMPQNQPPTASFTHGCTELSCTFTDASSDGDGTIASRTWDFGDRVTSTIQHPSHTYGAGGTYTVTLTVTDDDGAAGSTSQPVTVSSASEPTNTPPTAIFTSSCSDLLCNFTDGSTDSDGSVVGWSWDFGDRVTSTATNPSHMFGAAGTYTVTLTVTDNDGAASATGGSVSVVQQMHVAELTATTAKRSTTWRTTVTITVRRTDGAAVSGAGVNATWTVGAPDACTTGSTGQCSVTSDWLRRSSVPSVTMTVVGLTHSTLAWDQAASQIIVSRPT